MRKPASKEMISASVELCGTESLFFAHPTYWHKRVTSENTQEFLLMLILSLQGILQNQSLETIHVCSVVLCFQHNNTACIHLFDECKRSNAPSVCHKILSIL